MCDAIVVPSNENPVQKVSVGKAYPLSHYICYSKFSLSLKTFLVAINSHDEPTRFAQAIKDKQWVEAMNKDIEELENNKTWKVVELPPKENVVGCKWVYRTKYKADGSIEHFKPRLVVQGFT